MSRYHTSIAIIASLILVVMASVANAAVEYRHCARCGQIATADETFCAACGAILPVISDAALEARFNQPLDTSLRPRKLDDAAILSRLSDDELRRLVSLLLERHSQPALDSNSVGLMTRWEMECLIRKIMAEQPKPQGTSNFALLLQYIGGFVLILITIGIIGSL